MPDSSAAAPSAADPSRFESPPLPEPLPVAASRGSRRLDWPAVDVIGDVHGCVRTLDALLGALGYDVDRDDDTDTLTRAVHPHGRLVIFVGDFMDRGRHSLAALRSARALTSAEGGGHAAVLRNHDFAAGAALLHPVMPERHPVRPPTPWVEPASYAGLRSLGDPDDPGSEAAATVAWIWTLPSQVCVVPAAGAPIGLVVTHAGLTRREVGRWGPAEWPRAAWGTLGHKARRAVQATSAEPPSSWVAGRWPGWMREWAVMCSGMWCVSGHTPVAQPVVQGRLALIDTGAAYGRGMTAFRWPESQLVQVLTDWQDGTQ